MEKNEIINRVNSNNGESTHTGNDLDLEKLDWEMTFDVVDDAIWILSHDQKVLRANKKSEELFKLPVEQPCRI